MRAPQKDASFEIGTKGRVQMARRDIALAILTSIIWGLAFIATRFALDGFSAAQLAALRFIVAAIPALFLPRPRMSLVTLGAIGTFIFTFQFILLFLAYDHGLPPGLASVTQQTQVFFTVPLAAIFLRDLPTRRQLLGIAVAMCGLALIGATVGGDLTFAALAFALAGALSWAIGNVLVKIAAPAAVGPLIAWASLAVPLPALAMSFAVDVNKNLLDTITVATWPAIVSVIYLGTLSTNVAYAIWSHLLKRYPTAMVTPFALLVPCTGVVASALIFQETFSALRFGGMALIVAGLAVIVLPCPIPARWRGMSGWLKSVSMPRSTSIRGLRRNGARSRDARLRQVHKDKD
jgi:O-acetylserine/cysteine efflux transporter